MDHQNPRGERVGIRQPTPAIDPGPQGYKGLDDPGIRLSRSLQRPALTEEPSTAVVLSRDFEPDRVCGHFGDGYARGGDPHARQRSAEASMLKRLARGLTIRPVHDEQ